MSNFAKRFKKMRKKKGLTQKELANKFNSDETAISKYENDHSTPDIKRIQEYADFFNVSVDYLLGRTDNPQNIENNDETNEKINHIKQAIEDNPQLAEYWEQVSKREQLQLMFDQAKDLPDEAIKDVIKIMMRIDKEEGNY